MRAIILFLVLPVGLFAQVVLTGFPSLTIPASSRGWAMGNTGIASSRENQSLSYNVAGSAFTHNFHQASVHFMPWLIDDGKFVHADYLGSVGNSSAFGVAINFLDLGTVAIRDNNGATIGLYKANEYNIGSSCALQVAQHTSIGATLRFIGQSIPGGVINNSFSFCGDLGICQSFQLGDVARELSFGAVVSNLGANINLPSSAGIGITYIQHGEGSDLSMSLDASRLLKDDWKGLLINAGAEYGFDDQLFLRGGLSLENASKGNRKYFSLGAGYKGFVSDQSWAVDIFYLIPFGLSPFQNSYGLTLSINIGNFQ